MATHDDDDTPVSFLCATATAIYFEDTVTGLAEDRFMITDPLFMRIFRSRGMYLTLKEGQLQTSDMCENKFCIQPYQCTQTKGTGEKAVMLYINQDGGKKKVVCCNDQREVSIADLDIPRDIEENRHKAIFYLKQISSDNYMFESSLYPSYYLGFDHNSDEDYDTLILRYKAEDEIDEGCNITLDEC